MRGQEQPQDTLFINRSMEDRIDPKHPLRARRAQDDQVLLALSPKFEATYAGRTVPKPSGAERTRSN